MIRRYEDHVVDLITPKEDNDSAATLFRIVEKPEELYGKGRLFNICTLKPGSGLGYHVHSGEGEFYHILSGEGEYSDNGTITVLKAGDTSFCPDGEGHAIVNRGSEDLIFAALIIYR